MTDSTRQSLNSLRLCEHETLQVLQGFAANHEAKLKRPFTTHDWCKVSEEEFDTFQGYIYPYICQEPTSRAPRGTPITNKTPHISRYDSYLDHNMGSDIDNDSVDSPDIDTDAIGISTVHAYTTASTYNVSKHQQTPCSMHALVVSLDRGGGHGSVPTVPIDSRYDNSSPDG